LQAHLARRHPGYEPSRIVEHDVDTTKEMQRLKDELNKKETELQVTRVQQVGDLVSMYQTYESCSILLDCIVKSI
jgi:glycerol-3-phosphate cytidylyltransferase-like family protein